MTAVPKPSRKDRKAAARLERLEARLRIAEVRHDAIVRAAGRCEWCRAPIPPGELHHLLCGNGRRKHEERLETLAFVCVPCHHAYHRSDADTLAWARSWAKGHGYADALAEVQRRIDKITATKWNSFRGIA